MSISAVIPVYNSERSLPELLPRLQAVLAAITPDYEVILVNDSSRDGSWAVIEQLSTDPHVTGINLSRNYGQHSALLCGTRAARYDIIVTLDDDLQHPPEEIPRLLEALEGGLDVVYGVPGKLQHGFLRNLASRVTKFTLRSSMGVATAPDVSAFRAYRRWLADGFADFRGAYVSMDVLLTWSTTRFGSVTVEHRERPYGDSNYTFSKLVVHALNMTTGFSIVPLRLTSLIGFTFTLFGGLVLVYVLGRFLLSGLHSIPGFPFLASIIAIFSGAQLFALGIIGEYLGRVHTRSLERPTYVIRDTTSRRVVDS